MVTSFNVDRLNISIAFTEYVTNLTRQILLGNAIRNARIFQSFPSGILFFAQRFLSTSVSWLDNLLFMLLLIAGSDSSLVNLFCRSVSSLLMFVKVYLYNLKPYLVALLYQVSLVIPSSELFSSYKNISYNNKNLN